MCPTPESARDLASTVVHAKLASAAHVSERKSFYWWEEVLNERAEWELICVTRSDRFAEISRVINAEHPYELPELIMIPISETSDAYNEWIKKYTG